MVQTYGVSREDAAEPNTPGLGNESSALLGGESAPVNRGLREGHATMISCVSNLMNTIVGSGMFLILDSVYAS